MGEVCFCGDCFFYCTDSCELTGEKKRSDDRACDNSVGNYDPDDDELVLYDPEL
jgi:hypothetical protein